MRFAILFLLILLESCDSLSQTENFPDVSKIIDHSFKNIDKLFPVVLLDISNKGSILQLVVLYFSLDRLLPLIFLVS